MIVILIIYFLVDQTLQEKKHESQEPKPGASLFKAKECYYSFRLLPATIVQLLHARSYHGG